MIFRRLALISGLLILANCAAPIKSARTSAEPPNIAPHKQLLREYHDSGAYDLELSRVANDASAWIEIRARNATAGEKLAVVFDIDETLLSNWPALRANDFGWVINAPCELDSFDNPIAFCGIAAWVMQGKSKPILPVKRVYELALKNGVSVIFLTGRPEKTRAATEKNLRDAGIKTWSTLILRGASDEGMHAVDFKTSHRRQLANSGIRVIANIGDQQSDLEGGFSEKTFKLPNPFYLLQ